MSTQLTNESASLEVAVPSSPIVVLAPELLDRIRNLRKQADALKVDDGESAKEAATLLSAATDAAKTVESQRQEIKKPFLEIGRRIDAKAKTVSSEIEAIKQATRKQLTAYEAEQERRRREAERKRQEELARLEEERRRREEEEKKRQEEQARIETEAANGDFDLPDLPDDGEGLELPDVEDLGELEEEASRQETKEIDNKIADLQKPAAPESRPEGLSYRRELVIADVDVDKLPDRYVRKEANHAAIRRDYCVGWKKGDNIPSLPGVKFKVKTTPITSRR